MTGQLTIALAAGGTGGHVFPAFAAAHALRKQGAEPILITDRRVSGEGFPGDVIHIAAASPSGSVGAKAEAALKLGWGFLQSRRALKKHEVDCVVGFGGYPSAPPVIAANHLGIPVVIHEQNARLGRANAFMASRASVIATGFETLEGGRDNHAIQHVHTGNPVRPEIMALQTHGYRAPDADGAIRLLILGGSQGAHVFSHLVPAAVRALGDDLRERIEIVQQVRKEDMSEVEAEYAGIFGEAAASRTTLKPFFDDIPSRLNDTHLAITRSGASTIAELAVAGVPAILVPYPYATDDHQSANARAAEQSGGAELAAEETETAVSLASRLETLLSTAGRLSAMSAGIRKLAITDAADRLAVLALDLAQQRRHAPQSLGSIAA